MRTLTILLLLASSLLAQESDSLQTRRAEGLADWEVPEAILVTARREFLLPERLPTPVFDLNLRDLEEQGARPLSRILETAPGVQMEGVIKGAIHLPSFRGFNANNSLVLLDGIPLNTGFANWATLLAFPSGRLQQLQLIRGAGGTHFGPNAQGGVINILGRDPQDATGLTVRGGSRGLFSLDASRAWQSPAAEWSLEAGLKESEGHLPNGDSRLHHLGARLRSLHGRFHLDAGMAFGEYGVPIMPNRYERFRDWQNTRLSARLQGRLSSRSRWNLSVYGIGESRVLDSYTDASLDTLKSESPFKTLGTGAELSFHRVLGSGTILGTGLQWRRDSADMLFLGGRQAESILGSFLRWTHESPGGMRSEAGLRGDWHSSAEAGFAGHLGFSRRLTPEYSWPELRARGQAYRGSRFPALREFYMTAPAPGRGDPDLLSESSIGWDAGLDLHLSQAIQLRLTRFDSNVSNLVERDFSQGMPWRFVNLESVQMNGWEWEGVWKPAKDLQLRVNHETLDASRGPEETPLNFRPKTRTFFSLRKQFADFGVSFSSLHRGSQFYLHQGEWKEIEAYALLGLRLSSSLPGSWLLSLDVENLMDREYEVDGHHLSLPTQTGRPRTVILSFTRMRDSSERLDPKP